MLSSRMLWAIWGTGKMRFLICTLLLSMSTSMAFAQEEPLSEVTVDILVDRLKPKGMRTRGLTVEAREGHEARVNLAIGFAFDSAELTDDARHMLDVVAQSLKTDALRKHRFRLAGHTDAKGDETYNQKLSEARAEAVRRYLRAAHAIEDHRLEAVGFGKSRLLYLNAPEDGRNRRVEITTLE